MNAAQLAALLSGMDWTACTRRARRSQRRLPNFPEALDCRWAAGADPHFPDARKARLHDLVRDTGAKTICYLYDFGDDWQHVIKLERWFENTDTAGMPFLLEGSGCCPPEDVGGPGGYAAFLAAIAEASHPGHADALQWALNQADLQRQIDALAQKMAAPLTSLTAHGLPQFQRGR